ncbi:GTP-binding protein [Hydrogenophaga sp.]|uniref:sulfate adenylyltransferase subunit 1 n=1 Tax=Hydrogenophaga sp. TaxID=1904254 RepID=UPI0025BB6476|nr:GTP-binding protein [Hydrogenophaga sp.]
MSTLPSVQAEPVDALGPVATRPALKFITCGSVDDGKSTLIGRLLVDSKAVLQDHLAGVQRQGETDLALLTDGLSAEREQGITIDVAYRYFNTQTRKFIIGDAPGHEQYTRNMVTAASSADAAVVLVDATKLDWRDAGLQLLSQTRRHSLLLQLLRVPSIVFAVNKLDAVDDPTVAFTHIRAAITAFALAAGLQVTATVPVSALKGSNVVDPAHEANWCGYGGPTLLAILEHLPVTPADVELPLTFPVQWVEKPGAQTLPKGAQADLGRPGGGLGAPSLPAAQGPLPPERADASWGGLAAHRSFSSGTSQSRRVFWGRVATGSASPGQMVQVMPSGQSAIVAQVLDHVRQPGDRQAGLSAGIVLDREVDVSRGDWLLAQDAVGGELVPTREIRATVAWLDDEPLLPSRVYWALHGHRWVKARVSRIEYQIDIQTLSQQTTAELAPNAIGHVVLSLQQPLITLPFVRSRALGSMVLVDAASHRTSGAVLVR